MLPEGFPFHQFNYSISHSSLIDMNSLNIQQHIHTSTALLLKSSNDIIIKPICNGVPGQWPNQVNSSIKLT